MRRDTRFRKKVKNVIILAMITIIFIGVYLNINNSRAKETIKIEANVSDSISATNVQQIVLEATKNDLGNYEIILPEYVNSLKTVQYINESNNTIQDNKIILSTDEINNKKISLKAEFDQKNVTKNTENVVLYNQKINLNDKGISVDGYMPLKSEVNITQTGSDMILKVLYSDNNGEKITYIPSEYEQTLKITLNKKMYMVEQSLISSTDAEYIVVEQSNS